MSYIAHILYLFCAIKLSLTGVALCIYYIKWNPTTNFFTGYDIIAQQNKQKDTQDIFTRNSQSSVIIDGITIEEFENVAIIEQETGAEKMEPLKKKPTVSNVQTKSGRKIKSKQPWSPSTPGTSGLNRNFVQDSDSDTDVDDSQPCCVCNQQSPPSLKKSRQLVIVNWAKCSTITCNHWVHLKFCHQKLQVSKAESFFCPCCENINYSEQ